jgi:phytoene/squalene synthetase
MPLDDLGEFGVAEVDLLAPSTNESLRALVAKETHRTRELLAVGTPLASSLPLRARLAVAGFVGGGLAAADSIERADYDVLGVACRTGARDVLSRTARGFAGATLQRRAG